MDFEAIKKAAQSYEAAMTKCLRDIVAIPGESADERAMPIALRRKCEP